MILKTISATYGRKMNLGDYNSAHAEITLWAELEEGDSEEDSAIALREMARSNVMNELGRLDRSLKAKTEDLFMGLPKELKEAATKSIIDFESSFKDDDVYVSAEEYENEMEDY